MRILAESKNYFLSHDFENVYVEHKHHGKENYLIGSHYGDPTCGIISPDETWFLAGGLGLSYFDFQRGAVTLMYEDYKVIRNAKGHITKLANPDVHYFIHSIKLETENSARILVDLGQNKQQRGYSTSQI
jgi:hypothetical protein